MAKIRAGFVSNSSSSSFVIETLDEVGRHVTRSLKYLKRVENGDLKKKDLYQLWEQKLSMMKDSVSIFIQEKTGHRYTSLMRYTGLLLKDIPRYDVGVEKECSMISDLVDSVVNFDFSNEKNYHTLKYKIDSLHAMFEVDLSDDETIQRDVFECELDIYDKNATFLKEFEKMGHIKILEEKCT